MDIVRIYGVYKAYFNTTIAFTIMQHIDDASGIWRVMIGDSRRGEVVLRAKTLKDCKAFVQQEALKMVQPQGWK